MASTAIAIAMGATAMADIAVLEQDADAGRAGQGESPQAWKGSVRHVWKQIEAAGGPTRPEPG